jgi:hypothetical protein
MRCRTSAYGACLTSHGGLLSFVFANRCIMGMTLSVVFNKKVAPYETLGADHVAVGDAIERLEKVAKKNKLASLSDFHSIDPEEAAEMFDPHLKEQA